MDKLSATLEDVIKFDASRRNVQRGTQGGNRKPSGDRSQNRNKGLKQRGIAQGQLRGGTRAPRNTAWSPGGPGAARRPRGHENGRGNAVAPRGVRNKVNSQARAASLPNRRGGVRNNNVVPQRPIQARRSAPGAVQLSPAPIAARPALRNVKAAGGVINYRNRRIVDTRRSIVSRRTGNAQQSELNISLNRKQRRLQRTRPQQLSILRRGPAVKNRGRPSTRQRPQAGVPQGASVGRMRNRRTRQRILIGTNGQM